MQCFPSAHPDGCQKCSLGKQEGAIVVPSYLPIDAKVMIIGTAPGANEEVQKVPFAYNPNDTNSIGNVLRNCASIAELDLSHIALANTVACRGIKDKEPSKREVKECSDFLDAEIRLIKPTLIVAMGAVAMKWLLPTSGNITQNRGKFFIHSEYKCSVFVMWHPSFINHNPIERSSFINDLHVVARFMRGEKVTPEQRPKKYFHVRNRAQLDWLVENLHKHDLWASDTETTSLDPLTAEIFMYIFSWKEDTAVTVDTRDFENPEEYRYLIKKMREVYENKSKKVFQNGGFDIQCLFKYGIRVTNYYGDTMLMHHLLDENKRHGLDVLAAEYTELGGYDAPLEKYKDENKIDSYKDIPRDMIEEYGATDGDVTLRCYNAMLPEMERQGLNWLLHTITLPAQKVLTMTEYHGVTVDVLYLRYVRAKYEAKMAEALSIVRNVPQVKEYEMSKKDTIVNELRSYWAASKSLSKKYPEFMDYVRARQEKKPDIINFELNVNSSPQLKELLIDKMGLPILKETKAGGVSTDGDVLEEYAKNNKFCAQLLEYRSVSHLKGTFIDGIEERLSIVDGKIHTDYLLHGTVTGRPSSRDPNLNNIPRTGTAEDIKDELCADMHEYANNNWGDWLVEFDLGQAEFRFWIQYAQDPQALYDLRMGIDIHKLMAAVGKGKAVPKGNLTKEQYKELIADVTKAERQDAKFVVFGIMYGRGAASVAAQLGISVSLAQVIINAFFHRYSYAKKWLDETVIKARQTGYTVNFFNRRRRLLDINSPDDFKRSEAERQAFNAPIQGGASDLVLHTMTRIFKRIWKEALKTRLILTVYDSLVFNIPDNELEYITKLVHHEMSHHPFPAITVPIISEMKIGTHWGSLIELDVEKEEWKDLYQKALAHERRPDLRWKSCRTYDVYTHMESGSAWMQEHGKPHAQDGCVEPYVFEVTAEEAQRTLEELARERNYSIN